MSDKNRHYTITKQEGQHLVVEIPLYLEGAWKKHKFALPPEQVTALRIEPNMELRCAITDMQDQFCNVLEVITKFGECHVCKGRFTYGNDHIRLSRVINWQSQGYPAQDAVDKIDIHPECFTPELLASLKLKCNKK